MNTEVRYPVRHVEKVTLELTGDEARRLLNGLRRAHHKPDGFCVHLISKLEHMDLPPSTYGVRYTPQVVR